MHTTTIHSFVFTETCSETVGADDLLDMDQYSSYKSGSCYNYYFIHRHIDSVIIISASSIVPQMFGQVSAHLWPVTMVWECSLTLTYRSTFRLHDCGVDQSCAELSRVFIQTVEPRVALKFARGCS